MGYTAHLGELLRDLRAKRRLALREVAAATAIDPSLLSHIETGRRVPTAEQGRALAEYFDLQQDDFEARRIAADFWRKHGDNPAVGRAADLIRESGEYHVNKQAKKSGKAK